MKVYLYVCLVYSKPWLSDNLLREKSLKGRRTLWNKSQISIELLLDMRETSVSENHFGDHRRSA